MTIKTCEGTTNWTDNGNKKEKTTDKQCTLSQALLTLSRARAENGVRARLREGERERKREERIETRAPKNEIDEMRLFCFLALGLGDPVEHA